MQTLLGGRQMTYSHEEAKVATAAYFGGDELAADVWISKYALRNETGELLEKTPADMHRRLAREFARIEGRYPNPLSEDDIYELLSDWTVVPQGSPMSGIGNKYQLQSLSNCFVIPSTADSFGSILQTDERQCQIMKRRGGVGHDISAIRPRGVFTNNAAKTTDGISAFMERFSNSCRTTAQGGRRGALMLTIACNHYEVETFIDIKRDKTKVTGANVSIKISDALMKAVKEDGDFVLQWPVDVPVEQAKVSKTVKARELWRKITSAAHDNAEPGILFWDNILKGPADAYEEFRSVSTNPCSEIPLSASTKHKTADSCRLMLVNLTKFVKKPFLKGASFDIERFKRVVVSAQRLMDDLVDLELECIDKIITKIENDPEDESTKRNELELWQMIKNAAVRGRRTGLGITGLGDTLAMLNIVYGSEESVKQVALIYKNLELAALSSSITLAGQRGAFPAYDAEVEKNNEHIKKILAFADNNAHDSHARLGRRNIALTTTAPAGSVSLLTQTTSGFEPAFRLSYTRRKKINSNDNTTKVDFVDALGDKWQHYTVYHEGLKKWMEVTGETDVTKSPYYNATSDKIDWRARVEMQGEAQHWLCHAISSTINLPAGTPVEVVEEIYMRAWQAGCKGITVYVDGSRDGVLVTKEEKPADKLAIVEVHAPKRPKELECDIHRVTIKGESYVVIVGLLEGKPYEVFAGLSDKINLPKRFTNGKLVKNGKINGIATYKLVVTDKGHEDDPFELRDIVNQFDNPAHGALTRIISLSLRHGVPVQFVAEQLKKDKYSDMTSFNSVIARVLSKSYIKDGAKPASEKSCGECGSDQLRYQEGCLLCANCGSSKCG